MLFVNFAFQQQLVVQISQIDFGMAELADVRAAMDEPLSTIHRDVAEELAW